jgi:hypothetical protein
VTVWECGCGCFSKYFSLGKASRWMSESSLAVQKILDHVDIWGLSTVKGTFSCHSWLPVLKLYLFIYLFVLWFSIFHLGFEDAAKSLAVFLVVMHFHRETSSSRKACKAREWTPATRCLFWDCGTRRNCSNFNFFV